MTRYAHQTGHHVERRFGWDCHGLPVEYEIDKALNVRQDSSHILSSESFLPRVLFRCC
jgi:isoleucyl-tRNA synthetase